MTKLIERNQKMSGRKSEAVQGSSSTERVAAATAAATASNSSSASSEAIKPGNSSQQQLAAEEQVVSKQEDTEAVEKPTPGVVEAQHKLDEPVKKPVSAQKQEAVRVSSCNSSQECSSGNSKSNSCVSSDAAGVAVADRPAPAVVAVTVEAAEVK